MRLRRGEINLYVSNLDDAATFYARALSFELVERSDEDAYRKLRNGDVVLTLFPARSPGPADPPATRPSMTADLHVDDDEIEAVAARLAAAGAEVSALTAWSEGRYLMFRDPDGIGWELLSRRCPAAHAPNT